MKKRLINLCLSLSVAFVLCCSFFGQSVNLNRVYAAVSEVVTRNYQLNTISYDCEVYLKYGVDFDTDLDEYTDYNVCSYDYAAAETELTDGDFTANYYSINLQSHLELVEDNNVVSGRLVIDSLTGSSYDVDSYPFYFSCYDYYGFTQFGLYKNSPYYVNGSQVGSTLFGTPQNKVTPLVNYTITYTGSGQNRVYHYKTNGVEDSKFYIDLEYFKNNPYTPLVLVFKVSDYYLYVDEISDYEVYGDALIYIPITADSSMYDNGIKGLVEKYESLNLIQNNGGVATTEGILYGSVKQQNETLYSYEDKYTMKSDFDSNVSSYLRFTIYQYFDTPNVAKTFYYRLPSDLAGEQYDTGYELGFREGKDEGLILGDSEGYNRGFRLGKSAGFNEGVESANDYSFIGLIGSVLDAPIRAFSGLLDFDILGVNMSGFLLGLFSIALIIAIIRKIKGSD